MVEVTEDDFFKYKYIQQKGYTNMAAVNNVVHYSEELFGTPLDREVVEEIIQNYSKYDNKFDIELDL